MHSGRVRCAELHDRFASAKRWIRFGTARLAAKMGFYL